MIVVQHRVGPISVMEKEKRSCSRCHGFMVPLILDGSEKVTPGLRCVNCGEWIDPIILANRQTTGKVSLVAHPRRHCGLAITVASSGNSEIVLVDSPVHGSMNGRGHHG